MVVDNPPAMKDWEHNLKIKDYKAELKVYNNNQVLAWKENQAK